MTQSHALFKAETITSQVKVSFDQKAITELVEVMWFLFL